MVGHLPLQSGGLQYGDELIGEVFGLALLIKAHRHVFIGHHAAKVGNIGAHDGNAVLGLVCRTCLSPSPNRMAAPGPTCFDTSREYRSPERSRERLRESLELSDRVDDVEDVAWCLIALGVVAAENGASLDAAALLGYTTALLDRIGATMKPFEARLFERTCGRLREALGDAELEDALAAGTRLHRADAVRLGMHVGAACRPSGRARQP